MLRSGYACPVGEQQANVTGVGPPTPVPASQCTTFELAVGNHSRRSRAASVSPPSAWVDATVVGQRSNRTIEISASAAAFGGDSTREVEEVRYLFSDYPIAAVYAADGSRLPTAPFIAQAASSNFE